MEAGRNRNYVGLLAPKPKPKLDSGNRGLQIGRAFQIRSFAFALIFLVFWNFCFQIAIADSLVAFTHL